ncbi:MAG: MATE family efflux transporter [Desulfobacterales bacterium RIFOXYA12_FULL_46_15]|nr:MAG: MATE family efflux transporter [Desulfobacterales bacterium RIFOXYA12_FULL_46_15]
MLLNEIKKTVHLSIPIVVGQLGQMLMGVVDNIMVGKLGATALAAASIANSMFMLVMVVGFGLTMAVTPLTAMAWGAGKDKECGMVLRQGILVNLFSGMVLCGLTFFLSEGISCLNQPPEIVAPASLYMKILGVSILPLMLFQSYRQFAEGVSFLKPAMVITLLANIVNVAGNQIFIFGKLGIPALGLTGAGIATISSRAFMALALMVVVTRSSKMKRFDPFLNFTKIDLSMVRKLLGIGIPAGLQYFFEVSAFSASAVMIGWMGTTALAAHQIALNIAHISFMVAMGISSAATIRVSNAVGRQDIQGTRRAGFSAVILCALFMASAGLVFILLRYILPAFYISDKAVIDITASLLIIIAFFQVSDGTQAVGIGILRGMTDMKIPTLITLVAYWLLGLPSGYILAFGFDMGIFGVWCGLLISLSASGLFMMIRFNAKSKKIILHP